MKKLLVTGVSGFLGWNICIAAQKEWEIVGTVFSHPVEISGTNVVRVDLTDFEELKKLFHEIRPDAVIHTAAATSPNYCEEHPEVTRKINVDTSVNIAGLCADHKIPCVFTSTDLVFDGLNAPYREEDPVSPINVYAEQKVLAEEAMVKVNSSVAICRMPLMFGIPSPSYQSFIQPMIDALRKGRELRLFVDEFRTPISGKIAARGLLLMLMLKKADGVIHLGGIERISRYNFGLLLMDILGIREAKLVRCRQKDMPMAAPRSPDVSLDSSRALSLGFKPLTLREEMKEIIASI